MSGEDIALVHPYLTLYSTIIQCKNLGISFPATSLTLEELNMVSNIYTIIDEINTKKSNKGKR